MVLCIRWLHVKRQKLYRTEYVYVDSIDTLLNAIVATEVNATTIRLSDGSTLTNEVIVSAVNASQRLRELIATGLEYGECGLYVLVRLEYVVPCVVESASGVTYLPGIHVERVQLGALVAAAQELAAENGARTLDDFLSRPMAWYDVFIRLLDKFKLKWDFRYNVNFP